MSDIKNNPSESVCNFHRTYDDNDEFNWLIFAEDYAKAYHLKQLEAVIEKMNNTLNEMAIDEVTSLDWMGGYQEALELLKNK
jgi:hypothetical protein